MCSEECEKIKALEGKLNQIRGAFVLFEGMSKTCRTAMEADRLLSALLADIKRVVREN